MNHLARASISRQNKARRLLWSFGWFFLFRISIRNAFRWRRFVLTAFGAHIDKGAKIYATARIWAPWNLRMEAGATLGDYVDCYNVAEILLEKGAVVSQYSCLCTATHDFDLEEHPLMIAPITLGSRAWVAADCFIAPGISIGKGSVVLARSTLLKDTDAWWVYGGYPAVAKRKRGFSD